MGLYIPPQCSCDQAAASVGLAHICSHPSYCRGSIFFLRVLNIPGLSTFPLIESMPVTLVVVSLSKITILKKLS